MKQSNFKNLFNEYENKEELRELLESSGFEFYEVGKTDLYYKEQHERNNKVINKLWKQHKTQ